MQGLDVESSTVAGRSPNAVAMPEWLEQKILDEMRTAYAWAVQQAAAGYKLKHLEQGLRERVMSSGGRLLQASLERGLGKGYAGGRIACAGCPGRMRYVADRDKVLSTWFREIRLRRAYYHCRRCKTGVFPLDKSLDVVATSFSPTIREAICLINAETSFERGQELLERLTAIRMSVEEGRLIAEERGRQLESQAQDEITGSWKPKAPKPREAAEAPERLYLSPDGTHIPIRGQKEWNEVKVGTIFTARKPLKGQDPVREQTRYVAGLENSEEFFKRLYVEALKQGIDEAKEVVVVGDGAAWIWNQAESTLPRNRVEIIDFYHATEKLWTLAAAVWGQEDAKGREWARRQCAQLYAGRTRRVLCALGRLRSSRAEGREAIRQTRGYFQSNQKRMRYGYLRRHGYFIGSGVTESSCKYLVGTRLKQAGMHWDRRQAQAILQLRVARLNERWDYLWN